MTAVNVILHLIRKEFLQILKDRPMLAVIFVMPIIQLFVLGYAITTDVRNIPLAVFDYDRTTFSRTITREIFTTDYFIRVELEKRPEAMHRAFNRGDISVAVVIPEGFSDDVQQSMPGELQIVVDGVDSNTALIAAGYIRSILAQFFQELSGIDFTDNVRVRSFYNPQLESKFTIVPGIIGILITVITMLLTALGLVREKEIGTLEQLNVTPIRPFQLILGKILPFIILGGIDFALGMLIAQTWFHIPMAGNYGTLFIVTATFLLTTLGLGMFISTISSTQQQAVFVAWFILVMSILMSGFMFPISNMPPLLQKITYAIPLRYFVSALREILLKGASLAELTFQMKALGILGLVIFISSILTFKKRV